MPPEEAHFHDFLATRLKERGISLKKLSDATGIAPSYLEAIVHGRVEDLPSAPYVRGYLARIGKVLDFDGEMWWEKMKREGFSKKSGSLDALPSNRFTQESHAKLVWGVIGMALVVIYLLFQLPVIFSRPRLSVAFPSENPYTTASSTITIVGTESGANSVSLNGDNVNLAQDGSWQETVLLENGLNTYTITAKKLLGSQSSLIEQIIYNAPTIIIPSSKAPIPAPTSTPLSTTTPQNIQKH